MSFKLISVFDSCISEERIKWDEFESEYKNIKQYDTPQVNIWEYNNTIILKEIYDFIIPTGDKCGVVFDENYKIVCINRFGRMIPYNENEEINKDLRNFNKMLDYYKL